MAHTAKINYVGTHDDGGDGAFVVIAKVNGAWFHHEGPITRYSHFTADEAERLAACVRKAGEIDLRYWEASGISDNEIAERWAVDAMERR